MKALFDKLLAGEEVEFAYTNGLVRSSKTAFKVADGIFQINHDIDGSVSSFSEKGIEEVFNDERSAWDGDIEDDEEENEDEGELYCPGCGGRYAHLFSLPENDPEEALCYKCWREIGPDPLDPLDRKQNRLLAYCEEPEGDVTEWAAVENVGDKGQTAYMLAEADVGEETGDSNNFGLPREAILKWRKAIAFANMRHGVSPEFKEAAADYLYNLSEEINDVLNCVGLSDDDIESFWDLLPEKRLEDAFHEIIGRDSDTSISEAAGGSQE